jgi:hypothetical protein
MIGKNSRNRLWIYTPANFLFEYVEVRIASNISSSIGKNDLNPVGLGVPIWDYFEPAYS